MPADQPYRQVVSDHFSKLIEKFGDDVKSVDWGSKNSQRLRFDILYDVGLSAGGTLLDVGCGRGDFFEYLQARETDIDYSGVDITAGMVELASKRFGANRFCVRDVLAEPYPQASFDFVTASGIFYLRVENNEAYLQDMITALFEICRKGIAFNCLSTSTQDKDANENHLIAEELFSYCRSMTPLVALRHDYKPNDFTVYMKKA